MTTSIKCQHDGCQEVAMECFLQPSDEKADGYYCGEHANLHGFCPICGMFWGGISSFEMSGICDYCKDELEDDEEWEDDDIEPGDEYDV